VPDGIGGQGNSRSMRGICFLPLTSHGTGQNGGRDRLLSSRSGVRVPSGAPPAEPWFHRATQFEQAEDGEHDTALNP
jgi:hypothetical protein